MTKSEQTKMTRLEIENRELRDLADRQMAIYRDQLFELVELRAKMEMIEMALKGGDE